jgi:hypothetical protein
MAVQVAHQGTVAFHTQCSSQRGAEGEAGVILAQQDEFTGCGFF